MIDIQEHINQIRYTLNQCTEQANLVNDRLCTLDLETIQLNVEDLAAKMKVAQAEMTDVIAETTRYLKEDVE